MAFRARGEDLFVAARAGHRLLKLMCGSLMTRLTARVIGDPAGEPHLLSVAPGTQDPLREVAQVEVVGLVAVGTNDFGCMKSAFGLGLLVAMRAPKRDL